MLAGMDARDPLSPAERAAAVIPPTDAVIVPVGVPELLPTSGRTVTLN